MADKILLGTIDNERIYLSKHEWNCDWYWGFGYIGNRNCHYHLESLLPEHDITKVFQDTKLTQGNWWIVKELFGQAYALKEAAQVYRCGVLSTHSPGLTDLLKSPEKAAILNKDLELTLDTIWDYLTKVLLE